MCDGFRNVPWKESPNYLVHYLSPIFEQANFRGFPPAWDWPETWVTLPSPGFLHSFSPDLPLFPRLCISHRSERSICRNEKFGRQKKEEDLKLKKDFASIHHILCRHIYSQMVSFSFSRVGNHIMKEKEGRGMAQQGLSPSLCVSPPPCSSPSAIGVEQVAPLGSQAQLRNTVCRDV